MIYIFLKISIVFPFCLLAIHIMLNIAHTLKKIMLLSRVSFRILYLYFQKLSLSLIQSHTNISLTKVKDLSRGDVRLSESLGARAQISWCLNLLLALPRGSWGNSAKLPSSKEAQSQSLQYHTIPPLRPFCQHLAVKV